MMCSQWELMLNDISSKQYDFSVRNHTFIAQR